MPASNAYLKPELIARIAAVGLRATGVVEGTITGLHRSPLHGLSPEFADYRDYTPGDDLKHLDWRAYARSDRFYIKRFEEESNLRAWLVVDASASMGYGERGRTKYDVAATVAASMAALCVKQRDAVGLVTFDTEGRSELRPGATQLQLAKIAELLEGITPAGDTDLGPVLASLADRIPRRGVVVLLSDLFTPLESVYDALGKLQYAGHEVLVFHVLDRDEMELPFRTSVIFRDIEGEEELYAEPWAFRRAYQRAMQQFVDEVRSRCQYCGIDYLQIVTDEDLGLKLSHYLHQRLNRGPMKHRGRMASLEKEASK